MGELDPIHRSGQSDVRYDTCERRVLLQACHCDFSLIGARYPKSSAFQYLSQVETDDRVVLDNQYMGHDIALQ